MRCTVIEPVRKVRQLPSRRGLFVLDNETISGQTSTEIGIRQILSDLEKRSERFDLVIFDFITACNSSDATVTKTTTLLNVMALFKQAKNTFGAPFVVFTQLYAKSKQRSEFEQRIEWASHLVNDATLCVEIIKDDVRKRTMLRRHQTRFDTGNLPSFAVAKFGNGRLVDLSEDEAKVRLRAVCDGERRDSGHVRRGASRVSIKYAARFGSCRAPVTSRSSACISCRIRRCMGRCVPVSRRASVFARPMQDDAGRAR